MSLFESLESNGSISLLHRLFDDPEYDIDGEMSQLYRATADICRLPWRCGLASLDEMSRDAKIAYCKDYVDIYLQRKGYFKSG